VGVESVARVDDHVNHQRTNKLEQRMGGDGDELNERGAKEIDKVALGLALCFRESEDL
jgi:hypothetical protein